MRRRQLRLWLYQEALTSRRTRLGCRQTGLRSRQLRLGPCRADLRSRQPRLRSCQHDPSSRQQDLSRCRTGKSSVAPPLMPRQLLKSLLRVHTWPVVPHCHDVDSGIVWPEATAGSTLSLRQGDGGSRLDAPMALYRLNKIG